MSSSSSTEDNEAMVQCDGLGPILFSDSEERKFYAGFSLNQLTVKLGDCVRVTLEDDSAEDPAASVSCGFAQVLAVYVDSAEEMFVEARWFLQRHELSAAAQKAIAADNELVESDHIDDIAAGSITELISIRGMDRESNSFTSEQFACRFFSSSGGRGLQKVNSWSLRKRGLEMSLYKYAYIEHAQELAGSTGAAVAEGDDYARAIQRLHISVIPDSLPHRQTERAQIESYIREGICNGVAKNPLYICGMPGTGKTATVLSCINSLRREVEQGSLPDFNFIEINCLRLKSPTDAYTQLWRGLSGYHIGWQAAKKRLNSLFRDNDTTVVSAVSTERRLLVCLMDELDYLLSRDYGVMYNFFDWPMQHAGFLLVGIANTMDLPERISARVEGRAKLQIARTTFSPYSHEAIKEILFQRLEELNLQAFDSKAREFVARKASAVAGDLRAALRICQTTIEMYRDLKLEQERQWQRSNRKFNAEKPMVDTVDSKIHSLVIAAVQKYRETPFISMIERMSALEKAVLLCFCKHRRLICGGDEHGSLAGMTCNMAWERFEDLMQKIRADEFFHQSTASSSSSSSLPSSSSSANTENRSLSSSAQKAVSVDHILPYPPLHVFRQILDLLKEKGMLYSTTSYRPCGRPVVFFHVTSSLLYSDFVAAMAGDPLERFAVNA